MPTIREMWRQYENDQLIARMQALGFGGGVDAWSSTKAYAGGEEVTHGGNIWRALRASTNVTPVEGLDWTKAVSGGSKRTWQFVKEGNLVVANGTNRIYNDTGAAVTLGVVRFSVSTAPTGSGVNAELAINGVVAATGTIAAGGTTSTASITNNVWANGAYLTVNITAVGSTTPGAGLVVQITEG